MKIFENLFTSNEKSVLYEDSDIFQMGPVTLQADFGDFSKGDEVPIVCVDYGEATFKIYSESNEVMFECSILIYFETSI